MTLCARSRAGVAIRLTDERWAHIVEDHTELAGMREEVKGTDMAPQEVAEYLELVSVLRNTPRRYLWSSYDEQADVLYNNFKKPARATESELTDDDVIIRYEGEEVVGLTVLHASAR